MTRFGWKRWWGSGPRPLTADGKRCCKMCPKAVATGRREYCSEKCSDEYNIRTNGSYARHRVWKRDKGVCAECGFDTAALDRERDAAIRLDKRIHIKMQRRGLLTGFVNRRGTEIYQRRPTSAPWHYKRLWEAKARALGFNPSAALWEADHILPVVEGGGGCGLDNLRTLCIPCHRKATAELAARLAKKRKRAKPLPMFATTAEDPS